MNDLKKWVLLTGHYNFSGTHGFGCQQADQANWATASNEDIVTKFDVGLVARMDTYR